MKNSIYKIRLSIIKSKLFIYENIKDRAPSISRKLEKAILTSSTRTFRDINKHINKSIT